MSITRQLIKQSVKSIDPFDDIESTHKLDVLNWIDSGVPILRISKPDNPPKHLVSYFVLLDMTNKSILLIDHIKAKSWLPTGGHVEINEDPIDAVIREAKEELQINASFDTPFGKNPLFITVTKTKNDNVHTDVSLWYVISGSSKDVYKFDTKEMNGYKWFSFNDILAMDTNLLDPHMHRFVNKLMLALRSLDA